ncbi:MAG: hypothetical protein LBD97_06350 [Bifidobacteriaceae bacterium]|jgi:hypothetical protein|nr:hypothetical protein [Bifidobacteriaceae bacterium]
MTTVDTTERLRARDRCDRCGARAYVRAVFANGPLLFCAHHARAARPALERQAFQIDDFTEDLDQAELGV